MRIFDSRFVQLASKAKIMTESSYGIPDITRWDDLLNKKTMYMKDVTIQLRVEITVKNLNHSERSTLKIEAATVVFRLTVENAEHLMAVQSPRLMYVALLRIY